MPFIGFNMFGVMSMVVPLVFVVVVGVIVYVVIKNISGWNHNNKQPVIPAEVVVVDKRADIGNHRHHTANGFAHAHTHTTYYMTYQLQNGQRMELRVPFQEYGCAVQGDRGVLTFQGSRFISFDRRVG